MSVTILELEQVIASLPSLEAFDAMQGERDKALGGIKHLESRVERLTETCVKYNQILSRIDYLVGEPNDLEVSVFDLEQDPQGVVERVMKRVDHLESRPEEGGGDAS